MSEARPDVDLFCRVVDNYGDIGVCWRLARRLTHELGQTVRLWVDDLASFARLEPAIATGLAIQHLGGIEIREWRPADQPWPEPAPRVIEAFACELPEGFRARLQPGVQWVNLEYLSAEDWVESCHGLPSPQPSGLHKRFVFPGFSPRTGGLLRESDLLRERDAFQADADARRDWLVGIGVPYALATEVTHSHRRLITVFCYPQAPLASLLTQVAQAPWPSLVLLAGGSGTGTLSSGAGMVLQRVPFLRHPDYDRLLWAADLNLVRGEDSFVRAQLAGRPLLWHIYPQDDDAHRIKLEAWLAKARPPGDLATLHHGWNQEPAALPAEWPAGLLPTGHQAWQDWRQWAAEWSAMLFDLPELADGLLAMPRDTTLSR